MITIRGRVDTDNLLKMKTFYGKALEKENLVFFQGFGTLFSN